MNYNMRVELKKKFPNLFNFYVSDDVSSATPQYNCIAWAYGTNTNRFWPNIYGYYWPPEISNSCDINSFKELFNSIGYVECEDGNLENGFIKVAIFIDNFGTPTHAARQLQNGYWTSKLGMYEDICHTIEGMSNGCYGSVAVFMKKTI